MTEPVPEQQEVAAPPPVVVAPTPDSRLAALHSQYAAAKEAADAAKAHLDTIVDGIKAELRRTAPGKDRLALTSAYGPTLSLTKSTPTRFDAKKFRAAVIASQSAALLQMYKQFETTGEQWTLKIAGS